MKKLNVSMLSSLAKVFPDKIYGNAVETDQTEGLEERCGL